MAVGARINSAPSHGEGTDRPLNYSFTLRPWHNARYLSQPGITPFHIKCGFVGTH